MKYIHKISFLFIFFSFFLSFWEGCGGASFAQNKNNDSLLRLIQNDKEDTSKVNHLISLADELRNNAPEKSMRYAKQALFLSREKKLKKGIGTANIIIGTAITNLGKYEEALKYLSNGLEICQSINDKKNIARAFGNIGIVYYNKADYPKALIYYLKALKIDEELNDKIGIAKRLGNIGSVYTNEGDYYKALDYYLKALEIAKILGDKQQQAYNLGNIGNVYLCQADYPKFTQAERNEAFRQALSYDLKALKMDEELENKNGIARHLVNIGGIYHKQGNYSKALDYFLNALKMHEELGNESGIAVDLGNIGSFYAANGKFREAEIYLKRAIALNIRIGALKELMEAYESISEFYDFAGRHKLALIHYKKANALKDTLFSQENKKELVQKEMNYEFEKKEAITKAENEKQEAIVEEKNRKQKVITWSVTSGLLLVIIFSGFIFRTLRITHKQKKIIEIKKTETEQQKKIIEEKNKDITDSIRYAKRIQDALMGEQGHVSMHLPEHFILFMPKDIVSGDFHWGAEKQGYWYFAAVDCTGHGVPGAVMSMLGISFLNDIVSSDQLFCPAEVLDRLCDRIIKELRQTGETGGSKDGMDISLARLDLKTNELQWAGANNSLNLFRNGQLEELKGDKQPIGYHPESRPFTNHEIELQKGDSIYIYSDGYADQFGGPKGKKFKYKQLEDLIIANNQLAMNDQKEILKKHFTEWRGILEQIDDVCVFGVRV